MEESRGDVYSPMIATFQTLLIMPIVSVIRPCHGKLMFLPYRPLHPCSLDCKGFKREVLEKYYNHIWYEAGMRF